MNSVIESASKELVSVIIPVYNHAATIADCLGTIVWQAHNQPLELVVVNDGSTDDSLKIITETIDKWPDLKKLDPKIINQNNRGASAARNRGFEESRGEYVIFVDADSFCYPNMVQEMSLALLQHPEASYAYSQFRFGWKKMSSHVFDPELLKTSSYIDTTSLIRRRDFSDFPAPGEPWDESLKRFQDWDLWLTMLEQNKIGVFVPKVLYRKIIGSRRGISNWLPRLVYHLPWKLPAVKEYEAAREIVLRKHGQLAK